MQASDWLTLCRGEFFFESKGIEMSLVLGNDKLVLNAFAVLVNAAPGYADYNYHREYIKGYGKAEYLTALDELFSAHTDAQLAALLLTNTGLDVIDL